MNKNTRLLFIENDLADQTSSLTYFLKSNNTSYTISSTSSLLEAEQYISSQSIDLVVFDHRLCNARSLEAFFKMVQHIPVILIADEHIEDHNIIEMMKQGADDILKRDKEGRYGKNLPEAIEKSLARSQVIAQRNLTLKSDLSAKTDPLLRLTTVLAHDLSNMISPILGFSKMMLEETNQDDPHYELLQEIHSSAIRAKNMVRQLSIFREKDASNFTQINLRDVLHQDFHKALQSTLSEHVTIEIQTDTPLSTIHGDIALIEQAVIHLCLYLQAAIGNAGKVNLSLHQLTNDNVKKYCKAVSCTNYLALKAEATILSGEAGRIKTAAPWQQSYSIEKHEKKNIDRWLDVVKAIVKQHCGFIRYDDNENKVGVELFFPVSEMVLKTDLPPDTDHVRKECSESILLVEGNPAIKNLITTVLRQKGYNVHCADNEEEACEFAQGGHKKVDLLLADTTIIEPGDSRIFIALRKLKATVKACYMAPTHFPREQMSSGTISTEPLIQKPFPLEQLADFVRKTLDD